MGPHAQVDAHVLPVSDLLTNPVGEIDPDRRVLTLSVRAVAIGPCCLQHVLVRKAREGPLVVGLLHPTPVWETPLDTLHRRARDRQRRVRLAPVGRPVHGRREVELLELGEQPVDLADVLAAQPPAPRDQLRKLTGGRLRIRVTGRVARMPQPARRRKDPRCPARNV
jgi:hypothetical protein